MARPLAAAALFKRETLAGLRRPAAQLFVALAALIASGVIIAMWPGEKDTLDQAAQTGRFMLQAMGGVLWGCAFVLLPILGATTLTREREEHTLDLLRMTLIRPSGIIIGKLLNTLAPFFLIGVAMTPLIACVFFVPGLSLGEVAGQWAIGASLALVCAAAGICASALVRSLVGAVAVAFLLTIGGYWTTAPLLLAAFGMNSAANTFLWVVVTVFTAGTYLFAARYQLTRPEPVKVSRTENPIDQPQILSKRRRRFPYYLVDPLRRKPPMADGRNPVLLREWRWGLFPSLSVVFRLFYLTFLGFGFAYTILLFAELGNSRFLNSALGWLTFQVCVSALAVPPLVAPLVARDRATGTLDMVRLTTLSSKEVLRGKAGAAAMVILPAAAAMLLGQSPLYFAPRTTVFIITAGITLFVTLALVAAIALYCSTVMNSAFSATVFSYLLSVVVLGAAAALIMLWSLLTDIAPPSFIATLLSPPLSFFTAAEGALRRESSLFAIEFPLYFGSSRLRSIYSEQQNWVFWAAGLALYLGAAWAFYAAAVRRYQRIGIQDG